MVILFIRSMCNRSVSGRKWERRSIITLLFLTSIPTQYSANRAEKALLKLILILGLGSPRKASPDVIMVLYGELSKLADLAKRLAAGLLRNELIHVLQLSDIFSTRRFINPSHCKPTQSEGFTFAKYRMEIVELCL